MKCIPGDYLRKLVERMPRVCKAVVKAKGGYMKLKYTLICLIIQLIRNSFVAVFSVHQTEFMFFALLVALVCWKYTWTSNICSERNKNILGLETGISLSDHCFWEEKREVLPCPSCHWNRPALAWAPLNSLTQFQEGVLWEQKCKIWSLKGVWTKTKKLSTV